MVILKAFEMHGDERVYRPGDEAALVAAGHNISKLRALGYVATDGRAHLPNGATQPRLSWAQMKIRARVLGIPRYSRMKRDELMVAIAAKEGSGGNALEP